MLKENMWFFSALTAAISWGIHYAAAGALSKSFPAFLKWSSSLNLPGLFPAPGGKTIHCHYQQENHSAGRGKFCAPGIHPASSG